MILLSVICVVLSLELGVATPPGNRFEESRLQNEGNKEFNVERNTGEPTNPYNIHKNENEPMPQANQKKVLMRNEDYENINTNNNPAFYSNVNEQPNVISESKEYNQNNAERNFNTLNDESSRPSYLASPPQVNRIQTFRPKDGESKEANMPRKVDILSEVDNPKKDLAPTESNAPIIQENNPANQIMNKYNRQNSQTPEILNDKKEEEEDSTQFDAPIATPEYIKSLYDENKQTKKYNVKPTITNLPRNNISNKNFQPNSQNVNEATFQNPSAEILYETGQAQPYEISNEPVYNSGQGQTDAQSILNDKQRLKNLYLSSKPTKHYMVVYPDGRVEQVDKLDKIQKKHPQYVMLNAKELLQHGKPNAKVPTGSQGSVEKQNLPITAVKPQSNSIKDTKKDQIDKAPQTVNEQTLPVPIEPFPVANEPSIISTTEVRKTNNVAKSSKEEVITTIITEKNIQNQLQEGGINDSQEKNNLNNNENISSGAFVTSSDIASNEDSTTSTTETPVNEDIVTTVRSTISTPTADTEILNQNIPNSLSTSNNTDNSTLEKEPEDGNSTPSDNLINTNDDSTVAGKNTTPIPKQESNEEDERSKNTTTVTSDLNTIKENSDTPGSSDTSNINFETITSNSSLDSSTYREESNSTTKSNNETVITFEDGKDSDGNTVHTENIIITRNDESSAQTAASNNVTSSDDSTLITNSTETDGANSSTENTQNNFTSFNSLTKEYENNTETKTIQIVSNVTNSEVNNNKNDDNNLKSYTSNINSDSIYMDASEVEESNLNKTSSTDTKQTDSKYTDDGTDDSDALPSGNSDISNDEDDPTATGASNDNKVVALDGGAVSSNEEDSITPATVSNDSPSQEVNEDDEDDEDDDEEDTKNEIRPETSNANDNLDTESPDNDENIVNESSFVFNASESFWQKLMNSNEYNSFYFLFPRPQPNTKETKKITYPNGTVVVETTEIINNDDGETTSSKSVVICRNCTNCEKPPLQN